MPDIMPDAPEGATLPVADGLREVAHWLEEHPEVAEKVRGHISWAVFGPDARRELEMLAAALGDRATERADGDQVRIVGQFADRVEVSAWTTTRVLGARPVPTPAYEPILKAAAEPEALAPDDWDDDDEADLAARLHGGDYSVKVDTGGES